MIFVNSNSWYALTAKYNYDQFKKNVYTYELKNNKYVLKKTYSCNTFTFIYSNKLYYYLTRISS